MPCGLRLVVDMPEEGAMLHRAGAVLGSSFQEEKKLTKPRKQT